MRIQVSDVELSDAVTPFLRIEFCIQKGYVYCFDRLCRFFKIIERLGEIKAQCLPIIIMGQKRGYRSALI